MSDIMNRCNSLRFAKLGENRKPQGDRSGSRFSQGNFCPSYSLVALLWDRKEMVRMFYTVEPSVLSSAFGLEAHLCLQMLPTLFPFQKLRSLQLMGWWRRDSGAQDIFSLSVGGDAPTSDYLGQTGGSSFVRRYNWHVTCEFEEYRHWFASFMYYKRNMQ